MSCVSAQLFYGVTRKDPSCPAGNAHRCAAGRTKGRRQHVRLLRAKKKDADAGATSDPGPVLKVRHAPSWDLSILLSISQIPTLYE